MEQSTKLDLLATREAKRFMGEFAWPTILLAASVCLIYLATILLVKFLVVPLWAGFFIMVISVYAAYSAFHDAVHGNIASRNSKLSWLNELTGYCTGWVLTMPYTAHRVEHLAHHRYTNDSEKDPDIIISQMGRSPWHLIKTGFQLAYSQHAYYIRKCWSNAPKSQNQLYLIEMIIIISTRVILIIWLGWSVGLTLLIVANIVAGLVTQYLFAYLVHRPHKNTERYTNTLTYVVPGVLGKLVNCVWGYQNYHSIHHLFPKVPFYRYAELFNQIEKVMLDRGAEVLYLSKGGWKSAGNKHGEECQ